MLVQEDMITWAWWLSWKSARMVRRGRMRVAEAVGRDCSAAVDASGRQRASEPASEQAFDEGRPRERFRLHRH